jgi:hypothetical protein
MSKDAISDGYLQELSNEPPADEVNVGNTAEQALPAREH